MRLGRSERLMAPRIVPSCIAHYGPSSTASINPKTPDVGGMIDVSEYLKAPETIKGILYKDVYVLVASTHSSRPFFCFALHPFTL